MLIGRKIWWLYTSVRPQACDGHKIFIFSIQENFDLQKMSILEEEFFKSEIRILNFIFGLKIELKYFNESNRSYF